jgi:antitoxin component of RelBE/YafQ-DinJ toxin-antitoxin module
MKNDSIRFRLPTNEKAIVLKLAKEAGLSLSDYMRVIVSRLNQNDGN